MSAFIASLVLMSMSVSVGDGGAASSCVCQEVVVEYRALQSQMRKLSSYNSLSWTLSGELGASFCVVFRVRS